MSGTTARPKDKLAMPAIGTPTKAIGTNESNRGGGCAETVLIALKPSRRS